MSTPEDMMAARLASMKKKIFNAFDVTEDEIKVLEGDPDVPGTYAWARREALRDRADWVEQTREAFLGVKGGFTEEDEPTKEDIIIGLLSQILKKLTPEVLTAPGGICAPLRVRDYLPEFHAERGGITYLGGDMLDVSDWSKPKKKKKKGKKK